MTRRGSASDPSGWVERAEHDLRTAEHMLELVDDCPFDVICFHAQQCAEKYLKALLVYRGLGFPFTHDLSELATLLPDPDRSPLTGVEVKVLDPYTIEGRYPGPWDPLDRPEAETAVAVAQQVRRVVRALLPPEAL